MENKREKIKIVLIAPTRIVGGQSIQARRLIDAFSEDENIELQLIPNNPELRVFGFLQKIPVIKTLAVSLKFWRLLLKQIPKSEIVQIFSSGTTSYIISTLPPLFAAKFFGKKTILHYHTGEAETHLRNWRMTAKPTMKMFDEIVVPSQFLVEVFAKFDLRATAVFNFIDTKKFAFRRREPLQPVFLSNRNFEPYYNVADVLRAFQLIRQKIPEARLIVAGGGSQERKLKNLAAELELENVEFVGRVENEEMPKIYDRADIFLNASLVDNMPLSLIEAFACGLPVVSSDAGGIPFLVENGETGILVSQNDYESVAAEAIKLLEDNKLAGKIISQARAESQKYSSVKIARQWRNFYKKLVA